MYINSVYTRFDEFVDAIACARLGVGNSVVLRVCMTGKI